MVGYKQMGEEEAKTISVKFSTYVKLLNVKTKLTGKMRQVVSWDDVIDELIKNNNI